MAWFDPLPPEVRALYRELDEHVPASAFLGTIRRCGGDLSRARPLLHYKVKVLRGMTVARF